MNGSHSSWLDVTSGVPQGSVLGPALFLLYINDISDHLKSPIRLFADDSIIYREISSPADHAILQNDLTTLATWADTWLMSFNVGKCAVMSITLKKKPSLHDYNIQGEVLHRAKEHDYLGVTISDDLKWTTHCRKTTTKASRTLGMLRRTLSPCSKEVKSRAYLSLVRPQLEYSEEAWNPHTQKDIYRLEQVQRQAARFVHSDFRRTTEVTPLVQGLEWDTLHTRRLLNQATMFYKIQFQVVNIQLPSYLMLSTSTCRSQHSYKYQQLPSNVDAYGYSFYPRAIRIWNLLPASSVNAPSVETFKSAALPAIREMRPPPSLRSL